MDILGNIFYFCVALGILIAIHEAGHFFMARLMGVYVERFSLGFGPRLFTVKGKNGTEYSLSLLPFGGYVKMYGESKDNLEKGREHEAFCSKKVWQRFLIVFAGPFNNIVLAWILYCTVFVMGIPDLKPVFEIIPDSIAEKSGFKTGDLILEVDGSKTVDIEESLYALISHIGDANVPIVVSGNKGVEAERNLSISLSDWKLEPGDRKLFESIGLKPMTYSVSARINLVESGSAAEKAGLQADDEILSYDDTPYKSWDDFSQHIKTHPEKAIQLKVKRATGNVDLTLVPSSKTDSEGKVKGYAGIMPNIDEVPGVSFVRKYDFLDAVTGSWFKTWDMSVVTLRFMKKFISGDISPKNISGPVGIAKGAGLTARMGFTFFLSFMALISVNLGILNLLPVPVLDGGHLFFYTVEAIAGKPLPEALLNKLMIIGMILLFSLMALAVFNDLYFSW